MRDRKSSTASASRSARSRGIEQVAAAQVDPFQPRKQAAQLFLEVHDSTVERLEAVRVAIGVKLQPARPSKSSGRRRQLDEPIDGTPSFEWRRQGS